MADQVCIKSHTKVDQRLPIACFPPCHRWYRLIIIDETDPSMPFAQQRHCRFIAAFELIRHDRGKAVIFDKTVEQHSGRLADLRRW